MSSCPIGEQSIKEVVSQLANHNFFMSVEYTTASAVSTVKRFLDELPEAAYRQTTDSFILFKNTLGGFLVEFSNGCSHMYLGMDATALQVFLNAVGNHI